MSVSDPIADMLTSVRNGLRARHASVTTPASRLKEDVCRVMEREGYIAGFEREEDGKQGLLHIKLKYTPSGEPVVRGIQRVSRPSLRVRVKRKAIRPVRNGLGISIMSTSGGVMTGKQAREVNTGGEVLCEIW